MIIEKAIYLDVYVSIVGAVWVLGVRAGGDEYVQEVEKNGGSGVGGIARMHGADGYDAGGGRQCGD